MSVVTFSVALLSALSAVRASSFDPYTHLGNLSPYSDAPNLSGLSVDLPESCSVDQVMLVRLNPQFLIPKNTPSIDRCLSFMAKY